MIKAKDWLTITADSAIIKLSRPTILNGVKQDKLTLRVPTVGDLRAAIRHGKDDREGQEIFLFASLLGCPISNVEKLSLRDYGRIQDAYHYIVRDDGDFAPPQENQKSS